MVSAGTFAAAHVARRYRVWILGSEDHLRRDRREGLGLQGRDSPDQEEGTADGRGSVLGKLCSGGFRGVRDPSRQRTPLRMAKRADDGKRELTYVDAKESEVPQAAARAHDWKGVARQHAGVWRLRVEG